MEILRFEIFIQRFLISSVIHLQDLSECTYAEVLSPNDLFANDIYMTFAGSNYLIHYYDAIYQLKRSS
jgi:hypothetical protein